ncbi:hypothetical protein BG910_03800 [Neisseria chenwenguii]|uniref:Thioesterase putative domain-containing protein n=1 Tax=Neisseria chenwenguii TaxID=1853278 RepID=A0A220S0K6_9NEIS|nr:YiiD C-terminal domain-containing protein [Neisseria chenwenguii]ASK26977.1 hypothetical protein BG910_03800 [Neisseria chenwenguii]
MNADTVCAQILQDALLRYIPAVRTLGIRVLTADPRSVSLLLPLAENANHHTLFGGSSALAATLCGWAMTHLLCPDADGNIVIQNSKIRYLRPAFSDGTVSARITDEAAVAQFHEDFVTKGKAKIDIAVEIRSGGELATAFEGRYVALKR